MGFSTTVAGTALMVLAISGCQTPPQAPSQAQSNSFPMAPPPASAPITLSSQEVSIVQNGLRGFLKDPASAIFSGPTLAAKSATGDVTVCGLVNAKNSYGGYTGAGPYIAKVRNGVVVDAATTSGRDNDILLGMCRQAGVAI